MRTEPAWTRKSRRALLIVAACLTLLLLGLDRYAAFAHRPGADSKAVVIYTTEWCPYCAKLRTSLAASGIPYVEHDVEKSLDGQLGFWTLRGRGVPVSAIGPKIIYGYDVARIAFALRDLGYTFIPVSDQKSADEPETDATSSSIGGSK
ncbi:MAG TPA: glutaredoxin domain-containing protein [Burkholderiales bacterium]|jgi:glutaredoxin|nr:glutaredoxin domain-containing protein [Burkholderiales bacterium]